MMTKFVDKIIWNKDPKPEYEIITSAQNVFIDKDSHFTVYNFFKWVENFFRNGSFFSYGATEPTATQTTIWIDTSGND